MKELISVVIPVYNEEKNLPVLYQELTKALSALENGYEIIFVDDGSTDKSPVIIKEIAQKDKFVRAVIFKKNYGQTAAIVAGIEYSKGELLMTIDADLQNDPEDIGPLLDKMSEGYDLVSGWRRRRKDSFLRRRLPSIIANRLISGMTGLKLHDYGCTLKIYRKSFLKNINLYGEMHRFIPLYIYWMGGKIAEVEVRHRERRWGKSKYGINRTVKVILDLITVKFLLGNYSTSPLYFFGRWGFVLIMAGFLCGAITLMQKIVWGVWAHKNPLLLLSVFSLIMGVQVILMGLLAELSMRIYYETTKKNIYMIEEKINC